MKSRIILILALIMALITTFFFSRYLKGLDDKYKKNDNRVGVVVAKVPIAKNQRVTKEMLEIKDLSVDSVHPEAVKKAEDIEGSYALTDMKKGEVLFASRFTNQFKETELVTRKIREGLRAVSIEVNFVESVSNLIEPEDYVDVVFSEKLGTSGATSQVSTQILLQNVRVLAVGK
jgi:pilus assembly protein CpaB